MGYTHYWYRPKNLNPAKFKSFSSDCKKIFDYCQDELGIKLANGASDIGSEPEATDESVWFNGSDEQPAGVWTTPEEISIPWPSSTASLTEVVNDPSGVKTSGNWWAGTSLQQRAAPLNNLSGKGSGSYETVGIDRDYEPRDFEKPKEGELYFECCKTAYRPYDLVVTAVLIAFKHYFPEVQIKTDGQDKDWIDAKILCNNLLGYGMDFEI